eukprot:gene1930-biopygen6395
MLADFAGPADRQIDADRRIGDASPLARCLSAHRIFTTCPTVTHRGRNWSSAVFGGDSRCHASSHPSFIPCAGTREKRLRTGRTWDVRFFNFYRLGRVHDASAAVSPRHSRGARSSWIRSAAGPGERRWLL